MVTVVLLFIASLIFGRVVGNKSFGRTEVGFSLRLVDEQGEEGMIAGTTRFLDNGKALETVEISVPSFGLQIKSENYSSNPSFIFFFPPSVLSTEEEQLLKNLFSFSRVEEGSEEGIFVVEAKGEYPSSVSNPSLEELPMKVRFSLRGEIEVDEAFGVPTEWRSCEATLVLAPDFEGEGVGKNLLDSLSGEEEAAKSMLKTTKTSVFKLISPTKWGGNAVKDLEKREKQGRVVVILGGVLVLILGTIPSVLLVLKKERKEKNQKRRDGKKRRGKSVDIFPQ